MSSDKIARVANVAQSATRQSASALKLSQQRHQAGSEQLAQLEQFKREYEEKLEAISVAGMPARQLENYRAFLAKLNQAIEQQRQDMQGTEREVSAAREQWLTRTQRSSSLEQLVDEMQDRQRREDEKTAQRDADEKAMTRSSHFPAG